MSPMIDNPTFHAILQLLVLFGTICSILGPLLAPYLPRVSAGLTRLAAFGVDIGKLIGKDPSKPSSAPSSSAKIASSTALAFGRMMIVAIVAVVLIACAAAKAIFRDATGAACEIVLQDVEHVDNPQICSTVVEVEQFVSNWISDHAAASPGVPAPKPSAHDVYIGIAAKHGIAVQ